ncbi:MAG: tyrosine-type recombinase/integrase [Chloroflexi bacterium]|nr:tyrosine-type recombinase/integrase [Chloroflexota bacterium]
MDAPAVNSRLKADPALEMSQRLPQALEDYLRYHRIQGSTEATVKFYAKELRLFLNDLDPACQAVADLNSRHVLNHLAAMKERELKPRSIRTRCQAIKTWLNWCVEWNLIESSPAAKIKAPKVPRTRKPFISEKQFSALLELCPLNTFAGARRQAMLWMMATTGIRRNEMWMLEKKDLDWDASTIREIHGKGQKERKIPFDRRCQLAMLRYIQQRSDTLDWLWVTEEGVRLGYDGIWKDLRRIADRAGVALQDTCHIFRRTFAANAVRQNIPRPYVKAVAGWSTMQMLDLYVEAMEAEEGAIEAFREFKPFRK